jgi:tRNA U38,U39,U40 pseudouridine synthase TruA
MERLSMIEVQRYIMTIDVSEPLYIDGSEWVSIKLHGQSFILHQIRKMICKYQLLLFIYGNNNTKYYINMCSYGHVGDTY